MAGTGLAAPVRPAPLEARGQLQSPRREPTSRGGQRSVALSRSDYQVQPGQHFAEIRFHRPANWRGDKPLVWWTEAASAKPGVDYVQQPKVEQAFPKGKNSMTLFREAAASGSKKPARSVLRSGCRSGGARPGSYQAHGDSAPGELSHRIAHYINNIFQ